MRPGECVVADGWLPCLLQPPRGRLTRWTKSTQPRGSGLNCFFLAAVELESVVKLQTGKKGPPE